MSSFIPLGRNTGKQISDYNVNDKLKCPEIDVVNCPKSA